MMFFVKRFPAFSLTTLFLTLGLGVLWGHRSDVPLPRHLGASITGRRPPQPPRIDGQLDLSRAQVRNRRLVQLLDDGTKVVFTIDPAQQQHAQGLLRRYEVPYGAIVVFDLDSRETVVLSGFSHRSPKVAVRELCLTPWAPAASVFKLVSASALLSLGVPGSTSVCYHGGLHGISADHLRSNPELDRTCDTLHAAVARSINPVIARLIDRHAQPELLSAWAERFGFNQPIPFEMAVEPSRAKIPEQRLEFARAAAGFWHTDISALHGAVIAGVAGTEGLLEWPHLVRQIESKDGQLSTPPRVQGKRVLPRSAARSLARMMEDTIRIGTASRAFASGRGQALPNDVRIGGKTGSLTRQDPFLSYSWFVGFARTPQRRVALSVLLGNPPRWRVKATTVARQVLAHLFADG